MGLSKWSKCWTHAIAAQKRGSGKSHLTCIATLPSPLSLTERNAVLFAPLDGHLPKFDLFEAIPSGQQHYASSNRTSEELQRLDWTIKAASDNELIATIS